MDRRLFIKFAAVSLTLNSMTVGALPGYARPGKEFHPRDWEKDRQADGQADGQANGQADGHIPDTAIKDRLLKTRLFDQSFTDDISLSKTELPLLRDSVARLKRVQRVIGYGNFCLLGLDDARSYARAYDRIGAFTKPELAFLEKIFYSQARDYGFMGEKPLEQMTDRVKKKETRKIPRTGNYLYRGKPVSVYEDIQKKIGPDAVLTSGIRGVMKQFLLFLNKAVQSKGNLSMASRSLAPPGYSFHGIGDFDVGKKGFGVDNFTEKFTQTRVYNQLSDMGYIKFRYDRENELGVRFEPWHVEVG